MKNSFTYFLMVATILLGTLIIGSNETSTRSKNDNPLKWHKKQLSVLVIKIINDTTVLPSFIEIVKWLIQEKSTNVFVEKTVKEEFNSQFIDVHNVLKSFQKDNSDHIDEIDFIICLGGHGTLFYATSLFSKTVPPVMSFPMSPPGFLTPFQIQEFKEEITNVIEGHATYFIRSRLECNLIKETNTNQFTENISVLNDVIIEHGSNHLFSLSLYIDGTHITNVKGDGLVISTPTGSSAFAASTGSSLIHPRISAILISAICPFALSFRSVVVSADVEIKIMLAPTNPLTTFAFVTFDGANKQQLNVGDSIQIKSSLYPVQTINPQDKTMDWFSLLSKIMSWNVRINQKAIENN
ncbi:NAD kinase-like isoform X2 [Adelges cooleyi]|nr:NAD kinase-like isoform X2 [Adelges cooleyi]XP_050427911.1 NAD kinase-like isoform X2 [Adelges cooleyi]XP_050427912.1 NAD kinase-like isoform X2 [Adelges cooleyi]